MGNLDFDERYPAMFQRGGGQTGEFVAPEQLLPEHLHDGYLLPEPEPAVQHAPSLERGMAVAVMPAEVSVGEVTIAPAQGPVRNGPGEAAQTGMLAVELLEFAGAAAARPGELHQNWRVRSWVICVAAALSCVGVGLFCLTAISFIPASRSGSVAAFPGMAVTPWGWLILHVASPLILAGVGLLATLLLLGSLKYPHHAQALRIGLALLGVGALVVAFIGFFYTQIFPEGAYAMADSAKAQWSIPWSSFLYQSKLGLSVLGLSVLAVLLIMRTGEGRIYATVTGKTACMTGAVLLGGAAFVLFLQRMFPLTMGVKTVVVDGMPHQSIPWPQQILEFSGPLALVGAGTLLWGVLILATSQPPVSALATDEISG